MELGLEYGPDRQDAGLPTLGRGSTGRGCWCNRSKMNVVPFTRKQVADLERSGIQMQVDCVIVRRFISEIRSFFLFRSIGDYILIPDDKTESKLLE